jgi:hypothetical protein
VYLGIGKVLGGFLEPHGEGWQVDKARLISVCGGFVPGHKRAQLLDNMSATSWIDNMRKEVLARPVSEEELSISLLTDISKKRQHYQCKDKYVDRDSIQRHPSNSKVRARQRTKTITVSFCSRALSYTSSMRTYTLAIADTPWLLVCALTHSRLPSLRSIGRALWTSNLMQS